MAAFVFDNDTAVFDFGTHLRPFACSHEATRPLEVVPVAITILECKFQ